MLNTNPVQPEDKEVNLSYRQSRLRGQKPPLKLREIWAIRTRLEMAGASSGSGPV